MLLLKRDTGISACSLYTFLASNLGYVTLTARSA